MNGPARGFACGILRSCAALGLASILAHPAVAQETGRPQPQKEASARPAYSESPEGLRQLIRDVLDAIRAGDEQKVSSMLRGLVIPDPQAWFAKVFGPDEGANLSAPYEKDLPTFEKEVLSNLSDSLKNRPAEVRVKQLQIPADPTAGRMEKAILAAMKEPRPLYVAEFVKAGEQNAAFWGEFFFVEDGFRLVRTHVFFALSNFTPRIRVGGLVMGAKLLHKTQPEYPAEAKEQYIQGTVRLQALIGTDGSMQELQVLTGHPVLVEAALKAVRQWRYQPTLINGKPVEVVTTIDVVYTLSQ